MPPKIDFCAMVMQSIKLSDDTMNQVRATAAAHNRSLAGQVEYWINLARRVENDPRFSYADIDRALRAEISADALSGAEQDVYFDALAELQWKPNDESRRRFEDLMRDRDLVGYVDGTDSIVTKPR